MGKTRQQIGNTWKQYKYSFIIILILLTIGTASILIDSHFPPNTNLALFNEMPELEELENGQVRLFRSGVVNSTSDQEVSIDVWLNNTYFLPSTDLSVLYYNGTNSEQYNASESANIEEDYWNSATESASSCLLFRAIIAVARASPSSGASAKINHLPKQKDARYLTIVDATSATMADTMKINML